MARRTPAAKRAGTSEKARDVFTDYVGDLEVVGVALGCKDSDELDARLDSVDHSALLGVIMCVMDKCDVTAEEVVLMARRPLHFIRMMDKEERRNASQPRAVPATHEHYQHPSQPPPPPQAVPQPQPQQPPPQSVIVYQQPLPQQHPQQFAAGAQPLNAQRPVQERFGDAQGRLNEFQQSPPLRTQPAPRLVDPLLSAQQASSDPSAAQPALFTQIRKAAAATHAVADQQPAAAGAPSGDDSGHFQ